MKSRFFCSVLALAVCFCVFQGCSPKNQTDAADKYESQEQTDAVEKYESQELGFSVEFPSTWKDRYTVEANAADESSSSVVVNTEWGGTLCYVFRYTLEAWTESGQGESIPVEYRVLGENDHYVYLLLFPGDVHYDPQNEEQVNTYNEMWNDLYNVKFEIIET